MRIAIAQINPTLGSFKNNAEKILEYAEKARQRHADLVVFPECSLFGYHPFDLLERKSVVREQMAELSRLQKKIPPDISVLFGCIVENPAAKGKPYFNAAVLLAKGQKPHFFHKQLLPTGDVFDEARFIEQGKIADNFFKFKGYKFLLTICEDIWAWPDSKGHSLYSENPLAKLKNKKVDLVINLSASPYFEGKMAQRMYVASQTAKNFKTPILYVNMVGAQDEIIFDGGSFGLDKKGKEFVRCIQFDEDLNMFDLETLSGGYRNKLSNKTEGLRQALVLGIRDYCQKIGVQRVHFGLSGGIDSALVACLAVDALGPHNVTAIALPSPFNATESLLSAQILAKNLGIEFIKFPIDSIYERVSQEINSIYKIEDFGLVHENLQARLRGMALMAYSNKTGSMLLNTSNKSEFAAGYTTLYGDMCGGLSPLGDLLKKQIYDLVRLYNNETTLIPEFIIDRPPSAELRPNQKDQDSLPPYEQLDRAVTELVENGKSAKSEAEKWLLSQIFKTEFKRWQAPPVLKVSQHAFGRGRRYPIAHKASV